MARVIHGPIIADAIGSAGPVNFAHYFGRPYVRAKQRPYVSNSPAQQVERELFASVARIWPRIKPQFGAIMRPHAYAHGTFPHTLFNSSILRSYKSQDFTTIFKSTLGFPPPLNPRIEEVFGEMSYIQDPFTEPGLVTFAIALTDLFGNTTSFINRIPGTDPFIFPFHPPTYTGVAPIFMLMLQGLSPDFDNDPLNLNPMNAGICAILPP